MPEEPVAGPALSLNVQTTYLGELDRRFVDHLRADLDVSVAPGLPGHLRRLGDASLEADWRFVDDTRGLLGDIDETRDDDFNEALDLQLIRRHRRE